MSTFFLEENSDWFHLSDVKTISEAYSIGVWAEGAGWAAAPTNFGQLKKKKKQEKIWAKPVFKDVSMFILLLF